MTRLASSSGEKHEVDGRVQRAGTIDAFLFGDLEAVRENRYSSSTLSILQEIPPLRPLDE